MPNCFSMTRRTDLDAGPVRLSVIDDELRKAFDAPPDDLNYYYNWEPILGFQIAVGGLTLSEIYQRELAVLLKDPDPDLDLWCRIIAWLDDHYVTDAWASRY